MSVVVVLGTVGAGVGLSAGLAFNLRLSRALGAPLGAALVNFVVGALVLLALWALGVARGGPAAMPPLWMLGGGIMGAAYVVASLASAGRLGAGVSTVTITLGQVAGAMVITGLGWLGQSAQRPTPRGILSAALLVAAVALLARDRASRGS